MMNQHCLFRRVFFTAIGLLALVGIWEPAHAADQEESAKLLKLIPSDANAVAIFRVEQAMQTPRAIREEWAKQADARFQSGAGGIPSWVKTLVVGFQVRPAMSEEVWAAGVASVPTSVSVAGIAQAQQVQLEQMGKIQAVRNQQESYLLGIAPGVLGIWRPAIRQEAARWARSIDAKVTGPLSDYLVRAAEERGHVVMAIDLESTLDPVMTQMHLAEMPQLKEEAQRAQIQSLLMGLKGATLIIEHGESTNARVRIDFQSDVGSQGEVIKSFFLGILHEQGAAIEDFDEAAVKTDGKSVLLSTKLSDESILRLISLVSTGPSMNRMGTPAHAEASKTPSSSPPPSPAAASQAYFRQIDNYVNDLARANRRARDYSRTAMWHENFALKIDELPVEGVDPELIKYAGNISSRLRALARSLRGQQVSVNAQQGTLTYDVDFTPGWASVNVWGGIGYGQSAYRVNSNLQQVRERQAEAISAGAQQRDEIWAQMTEERLRVLRQMQQKFGNDFSGNR